ncbi:MAG: endonuclease/exonuclease/phosphatase family protein, partial [Neisseriaceae bacterium]|nr:endonuclease/exonuclease/phosphatase family protein [Neisseriaceae bacterium]
CSSDLILHCQITPPGWDIPVECFCAHLNLMEQDRKKQYIRIFEYFNHFIDPKSPIILAGDFNDWAYKSQEFLEELDLMEAFLTHQGFNPKTFPSKKPMLSLDRIFVRNLEVIDTITHSESPWDKLSDHLPITAIVAPTS